MDRLLEGRERGSNPNTPTYTSLCPLIQSSEGTTWDVERHISIYGIITFSCKSLQIINCAQLFRNSSINSKEAS